jgi:glycerol dehydrogenase
MHLLNISPVKILDGKKIFNKNLFISQEHIFGKNPILIAKKNVLDKFYSEISSLFERESIVEFFGECSLDEISRLKKIVEQKNATSVIGFGGGKAIDTAKIVGYDLKLPIITIPTSSATGASSSALSAVYTNDGASIGYNVFDKSPDLVIMDYSLILNAPKQFLVFGIADSIAKYYESFAYTHGKSTNIFTQTALNLSKDIKDYLFNFSEKALLDFDNQELTDELKNIIKINIILAPMVGGLGGEGCRACVSHAVNNSFTQIESMRKFLHGEIVGFGNLIQLFLDERAEAKEELAELLKFHNSIGLMQNFDYFDVKLSDDEIKVFLDYLLSEKETLRNMPNKVSKEKIIDCLKKFKVF